MMIKFNPLEHPVCFSKPKRFHASSAWHQHIPFAMALISMSKPEILLSWALIMAIHTVPFVRP